MNQSLNLNSLLKSVGRHHAVIFIVVIVLLIAGSIFSLYRIVEDILNEPIEPTSTIPTFDEDTIKKIQKLHSSTDRIGNIVLPSPRENPFTE